MAKQNVIWIVKHQKKMKPKKMPLKTLLTKLNNNSFSYQLFLNKEDAQKYMEVIK